MESAEVPMESAEVYRLARDAGLGHEDAITATAIAWAESGLNPDIIGDEDLEDETWGPSCGLWQVRSLREQEGTGGERDRTRLLDPAFNAVAMVTISVAGATWLPWSVYKNGRYLTHVDDVRAAVEEEDEMPTVGQPWMPGAEHVDRGGGTPVQWNGPTVIVLHTTETDNRASYSGTEPHFEIDDDGSILQYVSLNNTAKALYNAPGGVETNRRRGRIIQIEIVNRAGRIATIGDAQLEGVAQCLRFVDTQLPFDVIAPPQGWFGSEAAWDGAPSRFSFPSWEEFGGICGHQHVPENDHWDPGVFPFERLASRLAPQTRPSEEEITMFIFDAPPERGGGVWQSDGVFRKPVRTGDTWPNVEGDPKAGRPAVAKHIGVATVGLFDDLIDIEAQLAGLRPAPVQDDDVEGLDPAAVANLVVAKLGKGLAAEVADQLARRLAG